MKRRTLFIGLAVAFQIAVVAAMAISREWILANGTPYTFQTAPVDPRDIFRGDYVRLDYLFSRVPVAKLDAALIEQGLRKGRKVYLTLQRDINGIARGERLSLSPPKGRPYLAGRSLSHWPYRRYREEDVEKRRKATFWPVSVKYGIEQYYVEQGSGRALEQRRGDRSGFQLPMLIHARVSDSGEAVIHSFEWANIAIKTELLRSPAREAVDEEASAVVQLSLKNRSTTPITLPLLADNCSFTLIGAQRAPAAATEFAEERSECTGAARQPVTLAPDEVYALTFDLNRPHWYVMHNEKPTPMGRLPWHYRYRIAYRGEPIPGVGG